jgi:phospholipid-binding lipoprotein MlaA
MNRAAIALVLAAPDGLPGWRDSPGGTDRLPRLSVFRHYPGAAIVWRMIHSRLLMRQCRSPRICPALFAVCLGIAGCTAPAATGGPLPAPATAAAEPAADDPFENANRAVFRFNNAVNHAVLIPVAKTYRTVLPPPMRQSLHDFLQNLNGPDIFANDVLQARPALAANTFGRLAIDTTLGVGGMFDPASLIGIPYHTNDFGITLATWGVVSGPYVVAPILGPSNPRDLTGMVADSFADPGDYFAGQYGYVWAAVARSAVAGIDELSRNIEGLQDLEKTSLDYYATIRSLYRQRRAAEIRHQTSNLPNPSPVSAAGD